MQTNRLTALAINRLGAGNHADGGGLYLRVIGGSRTYSFRYKRHGKQHWVSLGRVSDFSLAEARQKAREHRRRLFDGVDVAQQAKAARAPVEAGKTFGEVLALYIEAHRAGWKSTVHAKQWQATLDQHAGALLAMPVAKVAVADVMAVLEPIWATKTETASRVRGRIESVIDYASARHWRTGENPARWKGHLEALLPARRTVAAVKHQPSLAWKDMPPAMAKLAISKGVAARCTAFLILTGVRSKEARGARWEEIDLATATWTIPAARMKAKREFRVALSPAALIILGDMRASNPHDTGLVFPGGLKTRPLSDVAVSKALHIAAGTKAVTVHGCRSTFRTWCSEAVAVPGDLAESALAHTNRDKIEAAYERTDFLERRRDLMKAWGIHCTSASFPPQDGTLVA